MWFNQVKSERTDVSHVLTSLHSDGVHVGMPELMNYQNKSSLIAFHTTKNLHGRMSGNYLARSKGRGMEFDEVRHYQIGDDIRAIDWRVTARTGETYTKLFREEIERPVILATDLSRNMLFGSKLLFKSVQASHIASLVAWHAKKCGDRVGGVVFNETQHAELKPRSRQKGVLHYLHAIELMHQQSLEAMNDSLDHAQAEKAFAENCLRLRQIAKPGSLVYFISDCFHLTQEAVRHLSHVSRHCELIVCIVTDPLERELPNTQTKLNVGITDGENTQRFTLGDKNVHQQYARQAQQLISDKAGALQTAGARILSFCTGDTLENQLKHGDNTWIR
ncbi:DUF58 domain-containing protein [Thalassotalea fusca]